MQADYLALDTRGEMKETATLFLCGFPLGTV